ncbi:hypothetical protein BDV25DRAFT_144407 [Aspergillus avenaceus]|uniref:Uncharacterized protein n=1 Tax=Aspergillus avenaceus TaxID=36643 RepID=A0A5N6THB3_ASPAV|nr:hypothetical protein BDV25DRAFT_144407 [Aspergillus avenaceus]
MSHMGDWNYNDWQAQLEQQLNPVPTPNPALDTDLGYGFLDPTWVSSGGLVNGIPMENTLDAPRQNTFSGVHSLAARTLTMPQHTGNRALGFNQADADDLATNSGASTSGPELDSSPPYLPVGAIPSEPNFDHGFNNSPVLKSYMDLPSYGATSVPINLSLSVPARAIGSGEFGGGAYLSSSPSPLKTKSDPEPDVSPVEVDVPIIIRDYQKLMDPVNNNVDIDTHYSSLDEANESQRSSAKLPDDPTVPRTQVQKRAIVKQMCNAMASTQHAQDNKPMIKPFKDGRYNQTRMEVACWQVLESAIERHTFGPLLRAFDVKPKSNEMVTFAQRIDKILECLLLHKTICKHLLDPLYVYHFVDDPIQAEKRVVANRLLNKRKGEVMSAGKQVLGTRKPGKKKSAKSSNAITPPADEASTPSSSVTGETATPDGLSHLVTHDPTNSSPMLGTPTASFTSVGHQYASSPMIGNMAMSQLHARRMTAPTSHPRPIMMNPNLPYRDPGSSISGGVSGGRKRHLADYESSPEKRQR